MQRCRRSPCRMTARRFGAAYWRRPQAYLDPTVRAGISMLACAGEPALAGGLRRLAADLRSGKWHE